jgi:hypothetical protein
MPCVSDKLLLGAVEYCGTRRLPRADGHSACTAAVDTVRVLTRFEFWSWLRRVGTGTYASVWRSTRVSLRLQTSDEVTSAVLSMPDLYAIMDWSVVGGLWSELGSFCDRPSALLLFACSGFWVHVRALGGDPMALRALLGTVPKRGGFHFYQIGYWNKNVARR